MAKQPNTTAISEIRITKTSVHLGDIRNNAIHPGKPHHYAFVSRDCEFQPPPHASTLTLNRRRTIFIKIMYLGLRTPLGVRYILLDDTMDRSSRKEVDPKCSVFSVLQEQN